MKKRLLAVLLTAAMVLGMTACGSKSNSGSSDKKEEAQSTDDIKECTIKFQYWADNTDYSSLMQDIIKKFNEENKYGITVEGEEVPWDGGGYSNTLFNAAMGGGAPDVATFKLSATPMFTNNNLLADLTPYVDAWDKKDDISDNIYDVMKKAGGSDDSLYLMPWNIQVLYVSLKTLRNVQWIQMVMERQTYMDLVCVVLPVDRSHGEVSSMVKVEALMI